MLLNLIASYCGQTSHFSFSVKSPWIIFIAKLTVSRCFAIHDRRSMWSACHPCLFRPGLLLRPSTPLNNPVSRLLLSTALLRLHLFLVRLPSSFSPSSSNVIPSPHDNHNNTGAAPSVPSDRGSSSRSVRSLSSRNFSRLFGGAHSHSALPTPAQESEDPLGTLGAPIARAPLFEGAHFTGWAHRSRCNLRRTSACRSYPWS